MGDLWDNQILWKTNFSFPDTGTYVFSIEHAMRQTIIPGIMDVGLNVERIETE